MHINKTTRLESVPITAIKERLDSQLDENVTHLDEEFQKFKNGLIKCKDCLFTFGQNLNVSYNNIAEMEIRKLKVEQKISGCFQSEKEADDFMNNYSVVGTAKKNVILNLK